MFPLWEPKSYRVGVEPEQAVHALGLPQLEFVTVTRDVVCEATALDRTEDHSFHNLAMKEVKAGNPFERLIGGFPMEGPSVSGTSE